MSHVTLDAHCNTTATQCNTTATHPNTQYNTSATHPNTQCNTTATHPNTQCHTTAAHPNTQCHTTATHPNTQCHTTATHLNTQCKFKYVSAQRCVLSWLFFLLTYSRAFSRKDRAPLKKSLYSSAWDSFFVKTFQAILSRALYLIFKGTGSEIRLRGRSKVCEFCLG